MVVHHTQSSITHKSQDVESNLSSLIEEQVNKMYYIHIIKWNIIQPEKGDSDVRQKVDEPWRHCAD